MFGERSRGGDRLTLIDNRGVAKPEKFKGDEPHCLKWKIRIESFIFSVFPEMERVLAWAEDQETQITSTEITDRFGTGAADAVEGVQDKSAQLYAVMQNLMEGEAFSIVRNTTRGNGLEAWRKINRRFYPATGGSRKSLLRHVLAAPKLKLEELSAGIESWMHLVRRYEDRKDSRGDRQELPEDVKISILESLCPVEIARHLQLRCPAVLLKMAWFPAVEATARLPFLARSLS